MSGLDALDPPWRVVFDEAWALFRDGNFGVGAALVDPADGLDRFNADGLDELWASHPVTAERQPGFSGPLNGELARFARLLPLSFTLRNFPGRSAEQAARRQHPELTARADALESDARFQQITATGTIDDALEHLRL